MADVIPAPQLQAEIPSPVATPSDPPGVGVLPETGQTPMLPQPDFPPSTTTDLGVPSDWYGLFNAAEDYTDMLGIPPQDTSLSLPNLEFLYRFL